MKSNRRPSPRLGLAFVGVMGTQAGCATIFRGTTEDVSVRAQPVEADVVITSTEGVDVFSGRTPVLGAKLAKRDEYFVVVKARGYRKVTIPVTHDLDGLFVGNLLCGGIIGGVVDAVDGAMWRLQPNQISVTLNRINSPKADTSDDGSLRVVLAVRDSDGNLRSVAMPMMRSEL